MVKSFIFLVIIAVFGLFLFQGFDVQKYGANSGKLPGDVFYFLDRAWEWTQVNLFTLSEERKIELKMSFLEERLSELEVLKEKKALTQEKFQKQIDDYNKIANRVNDDIEKLRAVKQDAEYLVEKAKIIKEKNKGIIESISQNIPEGTESSIDKVIKLGGNIYGNLKSIME